MSRPPSRAAISPRRLILPLALAQFICSFAGSNMNVMITDISDEPGHDGERSPDRHHVVPARHGDSDDPVQQADRPLGRKRCFIGGLTLYGIGALMSALSPGLGILVLGNSVFEGVGTALLIPPVYILATLWFSDLTSRAWAFGVISEGWAGSARRPGPLIGGVITTAISWRAAFVFQAAVVGTIILLSRRLVDPLPPDPTRPFDARRSSLGGGHALRRPGHPASREPQRADGRAPRRSESRSWPAFTSTSARASGPGKEPLLSTRLFGEPRFQPRTRHTEHAVAAADGSVVRRVRLPSDRAAGTARSAQASSSPPPRSDSCSRPSRRSGSRRSTRSARSSSPASSAPWPESPFCSPSSTRHPGSSPSCPGSS